MNMKEFKFYPRGRVPEDAYVSFSCGYDFPGDEDGEPTSSPTHHSKQMSTIENQNTSVT
jgi:hypothetical protein